MAVRKGSKKNGLELGEIVQWFLITMFLIAIPTMLIYGWLNEKFDQLYYIGEIPVDLGEGIAVMIIAAWSMVSAGWIIPKYQSD